MNFAKKVTVFVTFQLTFLAFAASAQTQTQLLDFSIRMGGSETTNPNSKPWTNMFTNLQYNFYSTYSLGVSYSYLSEADQMQQNGTQAFGDVLIYLADKELWKNKYSDTTISAKLGFLSPVSYVASQAGQRWGLVQSLGLKQGFGDDISFTYTMTTGEYGYYYTTVDPAFTGGETIYNTLFKLINRAAIDFKIVRDLHLQGGGFVDTFYLANSQYSNVYGMFTSISYDVEKYATIDFGVSSAFKQSGAPDPWDGPVYSNTPFAPDGISIFFGTTIRI